nr:hypothetical protein CFP56_74634 [Quercus suber]
MCPCYWGHGAIPPIAAPRMTWLDVLMTLYHDRGQGFGKAMNLTDVLHESEARYCSGARGGPGQQAEA